jgi:hypothetical protein
LAGNDGKTAATNQDTSGANGKEATTAIPGSLGKGKAVIAVNSGWFTVNSNKPASLTPVFNSFADLSRACFPSWADAPAITVPWTLQPTRAAQSSNRLALDPLSWTLNAPSTSSSSTFRLCTATVPGANPPAFNIILHP